MKSLLTIMFVSVGAWTGHQIPVRTSFPKVGAKNGEDSDMNMMSLLEKEVIASSNSKLDVNRVAEAINTSNPSILSSAAQNKDRQTLGAEQWKVALAAASVIGIGVTAVSRSFVLGAVVAIVVFIFANSDPLDEEGVAGPLTRIIGRLTIQSVETSKPKLEAIARAAVTNTEEITLLKGRIQALEKQNAELKLWKSQKLAMDAILPNYTRNELKELARQNRLPVGGTKVQLLERLVKGKVIDAENAFKT